MTVASPLLLSVPPVVVLGLPSLVSVLSLVAVPSVVVLVSLASVVVALFDVVVSLSVLALTSASLVLVSVPVMDADTEALVADELADASAAEVSSRPPVDESPWSVATP